MRLSVIGCGYLGAVHAASMAELGHQVVGIDIDETKVLRLTTGVSPFFEPGLNELLTANIAAGRLTFSSDFAEAAGCDAHFLAVGTPQRNDAYAADLSFVNNAFDALIPYLSDQDVVIGKSTVPVGTAAELERKLDESGSKAALAWNPEFLREGHAIGDTISPDRIVYGLSADIERSKHAREVLNSIYAQALSAGAPLVDTDFATAELVKMAANSFLATKISFINAMAEISETVDADVSKLAEAIGHDKRIGRQFLNAGIGFGGGCLPKDIRALMFRAEELGRADSVAFLKEVDAINLRRRQRVIDLTVRALGNVMFRKKVAVLGLAFKPHSDDIRDSPALDIAAQLHGLGADVVGTDPRAVANAQQHYPQLKLTSVVDEALEDAEVVVLATEWPEFVELDPLSTVASVATPIIIDGRNALDPERWRDAGWSYFGLGRNATVKRESHSERAD